MTSRTVVAIFDSQDQAKGAARAIQQLGEDTCSVRQAAIVIKDDQSAVSVPDTTESVVSEVLLGGPGVGSMIGLLAGPVGTAAGILLGSLVGRVVDVANQERNQDFLNAAGPWPATVGPSIVATSRREVRLPRTQRRRSPCPRCSTT